jgi:glutathione S-transferase
MITVYAFGNVTPLVRGITRDLRALWALEEAGLLYHVHPLDDVRGELKGAEYLQVNPFGQVPSIDDDGLRLFESGAIVLYVADKAGKLLPKDVQGRALAMQWAFAALSTLDPPFADLAAIDEFFADEAWAKERRPALVKSAQARLETLDELLSTRAYLLGDEFTAPDILLTSVLRFIQHTDLLDAAPHVSAYKKRCEARRAWTRVLAPYEERLAH